VTTMLIVVVVCCCFQRYRRVFLVATILYFD